MQSRNAALQLCSYLVTRGSLVTSRVRGRSVCLGTYRHWTAQKTRIRRVPSLRTELWKFTIDMLSSHTPCGCLWLCDAESWENLWQKWEWWTSPCTILGKTGRRSKNLKQVRCSLVVKVPPPELGWGSFSSTEQLAESCYQWHSAACIEI